MRALALELADLYRHGREHEDLYQLAELLTDWDERIWLWRFRHYAIVARALGEDTIGTQGTPVQVLGKLIAQRQLPEAVGGAQPAGRAVRRRARGAGVPTLRRPRLSLHGRADLPADLGDGLVAALEQVHHREESVDHVVVVVMADVHAGAAQRLDVARPSSRSGSYSAVTTTAGASPDVGGAQRRDLGVGPSGHVGDVLIEEPRHLSVVKNVSLPEPCRPV